MNKLKVIMIGGESGSGKSSVVKKIINENKINIPFKYEKLLHGIHNENKDIYVIGRYELVGKKDKDIFPGTDRLSMAVQPEFNKFICENISKKILVLFEGERLFNYKTMDLLKNLNVPHIPVLFSVTENKIAERLEERIHKHNPNVIKGRKTKYKKMLEKYDNIIVKNNNNIDEQDKIIQFISSKINLN